MSDYPHVLAPPAPWPEDGGEAICLYCQASMNDLEPGSECEEHREDAVYGLEIRMGHKEEKETALTKPQIKPQELEDLNGNYLAHAIRSDHRNVLPLILAGTGLPFGLLSFGLVWALAPALISPWDKLIVGAMSIFIFFIGWAAGTGIISSTLNTTLRIILSR